MACDAAGSLASSGMLLEQGTAWAARKVPQVGHISTQKWRNAPAGIKDSIPLAEHSELSCLCVVELFLDLKHILYPKLSRADERRRQEVNQT